MEKGMDKRMVYITTAGPEEARYIGKALVEARLAACVNIIEGMTSMYWWEGKVQEGQETILIAKTRQSLVDALTKKVKSLHAQTCPCVISIPLDGGNQAFLGWIGEETLSG